MSTRYSHSRLGAFRTCPRKYKFQYIERITIPDRVAANLFMGNLVHRQIARAFSLGSEGVLYPRHEMIDHYLADWDKAGKEKIQVVSENLTVEDYIRNGREMLEKFYDKYQPFNQGTLLGIERRINFPLPGTPFNFIAIVDRLWRRDDGVYEISDFKTSRSLPLGPRDPMFFDQMALYHLAVTSVFPDFEHIEVAQHFLKHGEVISYRLSQDEAEEFTEHLRQLVLQTVRAERLDDFPVVEGAHCNYCEFFSLCPAKRHRLALEKEEGVGSEEKATMESAAELVDQFVELDSQLKELKAEHAALREDLIRAAKELALTTLSGQRADITVRTSPDEKFVTKTADIQSFIDLSRLVRTWGLDECFELNGRALMKDYYRAQRLKPEQLEQLRPFVVETENHRVSIRRHENEETDE
jgi:putative RecB family exonuclease